MSDDLRRKGQDDDFESLFESFERSSTSPESQPASKPRQDDSRRRPVEPPAGQEERTTSSVDLGAPMDVEMAREELLASSEPSTLEPEEEPQRKPRKGLLTSWGLTRRQQMILGALLFFVLVVYVAMGMVVWRSLGQGSAGVPPLADDDEIVIIPSGGTEITWTGNEQPRLTPTFTVVVGEPGAPTPVPESEMTPTPRAVSTRLDLQVLQSPDDVSLRLERGEEYLRLRDYGAALRDFERAQDLEPERAEAYVGMGRTYFYLRRWQEAEAAFSTAISFNPDLESAHFWRGTVLYYQGRYEAALEEFTWARDLAPEVDPLTLAWQARAAVAAGNLELAQAVLEEAFILDEELPLLYIVRGELRVQQEEIEGAQGDLLYAVNLAPHDFEALVSLARFYADHGTERLREAERLVQQARDWAIWDLQRARALHTLGRIYLQQGRKEDAKAVLAQASDLATVDGQIHLPGLSEDLDRAIAPD